MRDKPKENMAKEPIVLDFEKLDLTREKLRELILLESSHFKQ